MEKIFLSFHFDQAGRDLANAVENLIINHGFMAVTGERLSGGPLAAEIQAKIQSCDALICLFTERPEDMNRNWLQQERAFAQGAGKQILTILQTGSDDEGMFAGHKYVSYDPEAPLPGILDLSNTLGVWRNEGGRYVGALLEPTNLVSAHAHHENATIRFCCWQGPQQSEWQEAIPKKIGPNKTVAFLKGVPEGAEVQVRMEHQGTVWDSGAQQQYLNIKLEGDE